MEGSFQCSCNEGFTLSASGDTCIDTDECTAIPNTCGNGTCINTFGSYRCRCFYGFQMSSDNNCQGSVDSVALEIIKIYLKNYMSFQLSG